MTDDSDVVNKI